MGFALLLIGLLMVVTGARGTYSQFAAQVASEFQGEHNFGYWLIAVGSAGALGYIPALQTISRYLMALIVLSIFLSNKGFFAQFQSALQTGPKQPGATTGGGGKVAAAQGSLLGGTLAVPGVPFVGMFGPGVVSNFLNYVFPKGKTQ